MRNLQHIRQFRNAINHMGGARLMQQLGGVVSVTDSDGPATGGETHLDIIGRIPDNHVGIIAGRGNSGHDHSNGGG